MMRRKLKMQKTEIEIFISIELSNSKNQMPIYKHWMMIKSSCWLRMWIANEINDIFCNIFYNQILINL